MIHYAHLKHGGDRENHPSTIVVHCMGEFIIDPTPIHAPDFLDGYKLSAHALIDPNGDTIRCRDDDERAWHARGHNTNSLGVEFLVPGEHTYGTFLEAIKTDYVSTAQWEAGVELVREWMFLYNIPEEKVVRHSDISPGRKVDPGEGFMWNNFIQRVTG
jgi:AmpD protein